MPSPSLGTQPEDVLFARTGGVMRRIGNGDKRPKAKVTVAHSLIEELRKERAVIVPFLIFLWLLSFFQEKESNKQ